jgi:hypothetical protein
MTERLNYVQCLDWSKRPYGVRTVRVELTRENDEPAEMLLRFDEAERLRDDLDKCLRQQGVPG